MQLLPLEEVQAASQRVQSYVRRTPFFKFDNASAKFKKEIYLKCEVFQHTGSFKIRGAANLILTEIGQAKKSGVVAASAGNHAQGVAAICHKLGVNATIVMPLNTPVIKVQNTQSWGAKVILEGDYYDQSFKHALELSKSTGALLVPPYKHPLVMAGQGTIALELMQEPLFKDIEAILIPVGGGGLITGCASVLKKMRPDLKIYGVTANNAPALWKSFQEKQWRSEPISPTLAEGVAVKSPDQEIFELLLNTLDDMYSIPEDAIAHAISLFLEHGKIVTEGAGAITLAAVLEGLVSESKVCLLVSGGNVDISALSKILDRGLFAQGRLVRLYITLPDRPGGLNGLTSTLAQLRANIIQVFHQRATLDVAIGEAAVEVELETRGKKHTKEIMEALGNQGYDVRRTF